MGQPYPILEYDFAPESIIEPKRLVTPIDARDWHRLPIRERLFWLAAEACLALE